MLRLEKLSSQERKLSFKLICLITLHKQIKLVTKINFWRHIWDQEWAKQNLCMVAFKKIEVIIHKLYMVHFWILCLIYNSVY